MTLVALQHRRRDFFLLQNVVGTEGALPHSNHPACLNDGLGQTTALLAPLLLGWPGRLV